MILLFHHRAVLIIAVPNDYIMFSVCIGCDFKQIVIASPITKSRPSRAFGTYVYPAIASILLYRKVWLALGAIKLARLNEKGYVRILIFCTPPLNSLSTGYYEADRAPCFKVLNFFSRMMILQRHCRLFVKRRENSSPS